MAFLGITLELSDTARHRHREARDNDVAVAFRHELDAGGGTGDNSRVSAPAAAALSEWFASCSSFSPGTDVPRAQPSPIRSSRAARVGMRTVGVGGVEHEGPCMTRPCVTDRVPPRKRRKDHSEQPRLELPLHEPPQNEQARPQRPDQPERGIAIVDFYV
jgi:hypothetical protein